MNENLLREDMKKILLFNKTATEGSTVSTSSPQHKRRVEIK